MKLLELGKDLVSLAIQRPFHGKWVGALTLPFETLWLAKIIFTKPATFTQKKKRKEKKKKKTGGPNKSGLSKCSCDELYHFEEGLTFDPYQIVRDQICDILSIPYFILSNFPVRENRG